MSAAACAAIPSFLPVKPSLSSVVALTLTSVTGSIQRGGDILPHLYRYTALTSGSALITVASTFDIGVSVFLQARAPRHGASAVRGCPLPRYSGSAVREESFPMSPSAAAPSRASSNRVREHVRVRVTEQPLLVRNVNPTEDETPICHEPVDVVALTDPEFTYFIVWHIFTVSFSAYFLQQRYLFGREPVRVLEVAAALAAVLEVGQDIVPYRRREPVSVLFRRPCRISGRASPSRRDNLSAAYRASPQRVCA